MANTVKKKRKRKGSTRKGKITISQKIELVQKNDKIRTEQPDTLRKMKAQMPRTVAPVFRVKLKKKKQ